MTTNLPFENWNEVLDSEPLTGAALDRLTHRCHIQETKSECYRLQAAINASNPGDTITVAPGRLQEFIRLKTRM